MRRGWEARSGRVLRVPARARLTRHGQCHPPRWEVHKNNVGFMVMQTVFITALAGLLGLKYGRTPRTLVLSVVAWPVALVATQVGGLLLAALTLVAGTVVIALIGHRILARTPHR